VNNYDEILVTKQNRVIEERITIKIFNVSSWIIGDGCQVLTINDKT
jgi:hypothetical protein